MPRKNSDFLFALFETQRMLRLYADKLASRYGITRAQWAVLAKLERFEGLKQSELADIMEMQPITLTRLIDRLADNGLLERRDDAQDRRANRLYLLPAARPLLAKLAELRADITEAALGHLTPAGADDLVAQLQTIKDNVRDALQDVADHKAKAQHHG
ncbi:MAG: MarR family transcriptional regulator [Xanthobacteraceae bacterium]|nr:MarR family transcriptional regulator [Xanthobacteraceae bacterium]